jgi:hypothetical protein
MDPHSVGGYGAIACGYLGLNRPEEGKTILEASLPSNPEVGRARQDAESPSDLERTNPHALVQQLQRQCRRFRRRCRSDGGTNR